LKSFVVYFVVAVGGAIGAVLRYFVSGIFAKCCGFLFPWGTLVVNLMGALFIGFISGISEELLLNPEWRLFLMIGLLGGFTTFSTYVLETYNLFVDGEKRVAVYNVLLNNFLGMLMLILGFAASRMILRK